MPSMFQEKEKELDIKNIYSNRILKPPHKLNTSVSSSPAVPHYRSRKHSDPLLNTSRIRAKRYEQQRREDQRVREVSARLEREHLLLLLTSAYKWENIHGMSMIVNFSSDVPLTLLTLCCRFQNYVVWSFTIIYSFFKLYQAGQRYRQIIGLE